MLYMYVNYINLCYKTILSTQTRLYLPGTGVVVGNAVVVSSKTQINIEHKLSYVIFCHVQYRFLIDRKQITT